MVRNLPFWILLLLLPILAVVLILLARRSKSIPNLSLALTLSGITGAVFSAFFTYSNSTIPFAPYPLSRSAWHPIIRLVLLALYVGFGIGSLLASGAVFPLWIIKKLGKKHLSKPEKTHLSDAEMTQSG